MKKCSVCGTENLDTFIFCKNCGKELDRRCPHCSKIYDNATKYCPFCGCKIEVKNNKNKDHIVKANLEDIKTIIDFLNSKKNNFNIEGLSISKIEKLNDNSLIITYMLDNSQLQHPEEILDYKTTIYSSFKKLVLSDIFNIVRKNKITIEFSVKMKDGKLPDNSNEFCRFVFNYNEYKPRSTASMVCRLCGSYVNAHFCEQGVCKMCLNITAYYNCNGCGKTMTYSNYDKWIRNKKTYDYCYNCPQRPRGGYGYYDDDDFDDDDFDFDDEDFDDEDDF